MRRGIFGVVSQPNASLPAPGTPTMGTATNNGVGRAYNDGQADITFTAGTGIANSFTATSSPGGYTGVSASSPVSVTGLQSGVSYTFTITAGNASGTSAPSSASNSITATTVPQAPTIGTATAGDTSATVTYTAGATGGEAVSAYTATSTPDSITGTGASPITVSGLTNDTAYTFTVTATNANGTSAPSSASNSVTPVAPVIVGNYDALSTVTVPSGGLSSVTFAGIPQTGYSHLQLRILARSNRSAVNNDYMELTFNSDTAANYSFHQLFGDGSTVSVDTSAQNNIIVSRISTTSSGVSIFGGVIIDVLDYANTSKYKTTRSLGGVDLNGSGRIYLNSGNWRNTAAITDISITPSSSNIFVEYSQIALYGVKA
jgi:hypothetical protein